MSSFNSSAPSAVPSALVTGCSTGIGLATALALHRRGYRVFAGVRREESLRKLQRIGKRLEERSSGARDARASGDLWRPMLLDVARPEDVTEAFRIVGSAAGPLRVVVNNAGFGQFGALEDLTEEEFRRQWEVNVAGAWRVAKAALPLLRAAGGRTTIINVSSILGRLALPFGGPYASSKFALEALSDSLRVEVARWGIRVVVVEPGPIKTKFNENALAALDFRRAETSPYRDVYRRLESYYGKTKRPGELPASAVARVILDAIESPRPRTRYLVTVTAKAAALGRWLLPDRVFDWFARKYMGL